MAKTKTQKFDVTVTDNSDGKLKLTLNSKRVRKYFTEEFKKNGVDEKGEVTEFEVASISKNNLIAIMVSHNFSTEII